MWGMVSESLFYLISDVVCSVSIATTTKKKNLTVIVICSCICLELCCKPKRCDLNTLDVETCLYCATAPQPLFSKSHLLCYSVITFDKWCMHKVRDISLMGEE